VEANWSAMFAGVPDLTVDLLADATDGDTAWSEWDWHGTHTDGTPFHMRGVTVMGLRDGMVAWARLYMEPVESGGASITEVVQQLSGQTSAAAG
jgi:hypothetical protein